MSPALWGSAKLSGLDPRVLLERGTWVKHGEDGVSDKDESDGKQGRGLDPSSS